MTFGRGDAGSCWTEGRLLTEGWLRHMHDRAPKNMPSAPAARDPTGGRRTVPSPSVHTGTRPMAELLDELEQAGLIGPAPRPGRLLRPLRVARGKLAHRFLAEDRDA